MTDNRKPGILFYPVWVVLSVIGMILAFLITYALVFGIVRVVGATIQIGGRPRITEDVLLDYVLFPTLGLVIGFLQYLLLRRYLSRMGWWIVATVAGVLLSIAPLRAVSSLARFAGIEGRVVAGLIFGGSVGLTQWLVLRRKVRHAGWWVLFGALGWGIALPVVGFSTLGWWGGIAAALLPPIVTSFALWLLLDGLPQRKSGGRNRTPEPIAFVGTK